jgi:hypothetical protein
LLGASLSWLDMSKQTSKADEKESLESELSSSPRWGRPAETHFETSATSSQSNYHFENGEKKNMSDGIGVLRSDDADNDELRSSSDAHGLSQKLADDLTPYFFQPIFVAELQQRKRAAKVLIDLLQNSLNSDNPQLIKAHIATVVRLATECPFEDLRVAFDTFLQSNKNQLARKNITVPSPCLSPSAFFKTGIVPIDTPSEPVASLFQEVFLQTGRVSHIDRVLAWHPTYYAKFLQTYNYIMRDAGPLPLSLRNYIAILSASRWNCRYLIQQQEVDFLMNGGDPDWLDGIQKLPKKIYHLLELNQLLAHQPWLVTKDHISMLVKSDEAWTIAELVHAIVIMATFRALAAFVWAMGITPEIDYQDNSLNGHSSDGNESTVPESVDLSSNNEIIEKLKQRKNAQPQKLKAEERKHLFEQIEYHAAFSSPKPTVEEELKVDDAYKKYIGPFTMRHKDFDVKSKTYDIFHVEDYSWREQGYELVKRYYSEAANLLDDEFHHIMELTDNSFNGAPGVDTTPFRTAVWYYVHRTQGVLHDDYDYSLVNSFLGIQLKALIKKMVCEPYTITKNDVLNIGIQLQPTEKCHIALLATEARKQSELLYALRAVTKWIS